MDREELVEHFRACDQMAYQWTEEAARRAALSDAAVLADWLGCRECHGEPPEALLDLALTVSAHEGEVSEVLRASHCCACRWHCACGGYAAEADLVAVIAAFEGGQVASQSGGLVGGRVGDAGGACRPSG